MAEAQVRFYAELNDRLPSEARFVDTPCHFGETFQVGALLARYGVPAEEVDLVLINGVSASLTTALRHGDRVSVYPVFESFDIGAEQRIRARPLRVPRFVLDVHLGKLAALLRMVGFDAAYRRDSSDGELIRTAREKRRTLLSRDRLLIETAGVDRAYRIRSEEPLEQLQEVFARFQLHSLVHPFSRCMVCNDLLRPAEPESVRSRVPKAAWEGHLRFQRCPSCNRVYWEGSHVRRMNAVIERMFAGTVGDSARRPEGSNDITGSLP